MAKKISPNESLQQSTRELSTRSGDQTSLEFPSLTDSSTQKALASASLQVGGGSFKSYREDHIKRLHDDIEQTTRKLELEQRRLYNLDKALSAAEKEHAAKWQKYQVVQAQKDEAAHRTEHEVKKRERKLEKAYAKLNIGNAENEQLRERIDHLRRDRETLDKVFKQLERDVQKGRKEMERKKNEADESQSQGGDAKQRVRMLNSMLEKERKVFQKDCMKLKVELDEEVRIQKEMENPPATFSYQCLDKFPERRNYVVADEEESFSEPAMHQRILKVSFLNTILRRNIGQHQKNIEVFEQAFATIKSSTGISDIEEIVKIFMVIEQRNFSLMTYVNQLNREIESIEIRNRDLRTQLQEYEEGKTESEERRKKELGEVAEQIKKVVGATEEKDQVTKDAVQALANSKPIIWKTAKFLEQEMPALLQAGFDGAPVIGGSKLSCPDEHEEDLSRFLMYVEDMILQFRVCLPADAQWAKYNIAALKPPQKDKRAEVRPGDLPSAHPPVDDIDDEEAGLEEGPWTRSELRARAQANIQRRVRKFGGPHAKNAPGPGQESSQQSTRATRLGGEDGDRSVALAALEGQGKEDGRGGAAGGRHATASDGLTVEVRVSTVTDTDKFTLGAGEDDSDDRPLVTKTGSSPRRR